MNFPNSAAKAKEESNNHINTTIISLSLASVPLSKKKKSFDVKGGVVEVLNNKIIVLAE